MKRRLKWFFVLLFILLQSCVHPRLGIPFVPFPPCLFDEFIEYKTENEMKEIGNIVSIRQRIGHNQPRSEKGFFKRKWDKPYDYQMEIENKSLALSKLKINSIKILANGKENGIDISKIGLEKARFSFTGDWNDTEALTDFLRKRITNELSFKISLPSWYDTDYIKGTSKNPGWVFIGALEKTAILCNIKN